MNFKFTKIKTLVSVIISAIVGIYFFIQSMAFDAPSGIILATKFTGMVFGFLIAFVPIYLIWSLFEKKDNESSLNIVGIIIGVLILLAIILYFAMKFF